MKEAWKVVAWGLVVWGGAQLAAFVFARNATAMVALQAAIAEWGAGRIGITWSDPRAPLPTWNAVGRRAGRGAVMGAVAAVLVIGVALGTHAAVPAARAPEVGSIVVALVISALVAVRDELLLRGVVLHATRGLLPPWAALLACGAAAAAARWGMGSATGLVIAVEALRGIALGALWLRDRGAWTAWAANAAWTWTLVSVAGGILGARFVSEPDAGTPALGVLAVAGAAASAWAVRSGKGRKGVEAA